MNQEIANKIKNIFLNYGVRSKHNIINEMEENNQDSSACLSNIIELVLEYEVRDQWSDTDTLWQIYDDIDKFEDNERRHPIDNWWFIIN